MKRDKEPNVWLTLVWLIIGVLVLVGGIGLVLRWAEKSGTTAPIVAPDTSWGIANDSPIRGK